MRYDGCGHDGSDGDAADVGNEDADSYDNGDDDDDDDDDDYDDDDAADDDDGGGDVYDVDAAAGDYGDDDDDGDDDVADDDDDAGDDDDGTFDPTEFVRVHSLTFDGCLQLHSNLRGSIPLTSIQFSEFIPAPKCKLATFQSRWLECGC